MKTLFLLFSLIAFPLSLNAETKSGEFKEGLKFFENEKFDDALLVFKEITISDPSNSDAFFYLGRCYKESGNFQLAAKYISRALELKPSNLRYKAYAEILIETAPTPVPTPDPKKIWIQKRNKLNGLGLAMGLVFTAATVGFIEYGYTLPSNAAGTDARDINFKKSAYYWYGVCTGFLSIVSWFNITEPVPAHWEIIEGSMFQLKTNYADLDLLKIGYNFHDGNVKVDLATAHF